MPSWDDDGSLVTDPQREISLIYYTDRQGLEDRVFRIETERSSATIPDTRTSHNISNVEILAEGFCPQRAYSQLLVDPSQRRLVRVILATRPTRVLIILVGSVGTFFGSAILDRHFSRSCSVSKFS